MAKKMYSVRTEKKTGETKIDYYKVKDKRDFRYNTLKEILRNEESFTISINTNQVQKDKDSITFCKSFEKYLLDESIPYDIINTECTRQKKIFGIRVGKEKHSEFIIIFHLKHAQFTEELFKHYLSMCDITVGIKPIKPFEETVSDMQKGYIDTIFNRNYFEEAIYDSIFITYMRISYDVSDIIQ